MYAFLWTVISDIPLTRTDIFEIIEHIKSLGGKIILYTSGVLLDDKICQTLKSLEVSRVETSLLGTSADIHDTLSCTLGSFVKICHGIKTLKELGIPQRVKYIHMQQNFHQLPLLAALSQELGIDIDTSNPYLWCPHKSTEAAIEKYRLTDSQQKEYFTLFPKQPFTRAPISCGAGKYQIGITPNGTVVPCGAFTSDYAVGNIRSTSITELWQNSSNLALYRQMVRYPVIKCRTCTDKDFCVYCPAIASWACQDINMPYPPMCQYARNAHFIYEFNNSQEKENNVSNKSQEGFHLV